ncbi:MAG: EAL domain-containing protein [Gammaproteobacteria bacterium]
MTLYSLANVSRRSMEALAIAIVYVATAQLGFFVAIPPGNVTVIWPPSGIALTAILVLGSRAWAGIWLGSFLVNAYFFLSNQIGLLTAVSAAGSIALGSTLQAWLAALFYRYLIGPQIPNTIRQNVVFVILAVLSCLIAASVGASSLAFAGAIPWTQFPISWVTWWLGDLTGILTVTPVLLIVAFRVMPEQGKKRWPFVWINGAVGLALIACYHFSSLWDHTVTAYIGAGRVWAVLAAGLLVTGLIAGYVDRYMRTEDALFQSEQLVHRQLLELETLYRTAPIGLALVDRNLRYLRINECLAKTNGMSVEEHIGRTVREVLPDVADKIEPLYRLVIETGNPVTGFEIRATTPAQPGVVRDWLVNYYPLKTPDNRVQAVGAIVVEITERKRVEQALFEEKERARTTLASISDGAITIDVAGRVESFNPVAAQMLGWSETESLGLSLKEIFHLIHETTRERIEDPVQRCLRSGETTNCGSPVVLRRDDGKELIIDASAAPIHDPDGQVVGAVMTIRDVSQQHQLAQQLTYQATHDSLTGLVNRHEFERRAGLMLKHAKEQHREHALCFLDLDQFKIVNDTCGHMAGDQLLRQLTAVLKSRMRERDTLARLGGDEFAVLLGECPLNQALRIANQLRELVQEFRFIWEDRSFGVGVSIGLVPITSTSGDLPSLFNAADAACFAAKDRGRNCVHVYKSGDASLELRREEIRWITCLHQNLINERLCLYYQPIVPLERSPTDAMHCEILLRLIDDQGQVCLPGAFISAAERYNQMLAVDRWVVRKTVAAISKISHDCTLARYGVNVSGQSISNIDFLSFVMEELERTEIGSSQICFEITETAAIANIAAAMNFIASLKEKGCCFALDDFGSGLSSFAYLKTLPVDFLKIDGRFVKDVVNDPIDCAMVEAIHRVGHLMGIKTIAESVENQAIIEKLKIIGIDYVQGYAIAKPSPFLQKIAL